jgi:hypothetical protein
MWPEDARIVVADIEGAMFVSNGSSGGSSYLMWPVRSLWGNTQRNETHEGLAEVKNEWLLPALVCYANLIYCCVFLVL